MSAQCLLNAWSNFIEIWVRCFPHGDDLLNILNTKFNHVKVTVQSQTFVRGRGWGKRRDLFLLKANCSLTTMDLNPIMSLFEGQIVLTAALQGCCHLMVIVLPCPQEWWPHGVGWQYHVFFMLPEGRAYGCHFIHPSASPSVIILSGALLINCWSFQHQTSLVDRYQGEV